MVNLSDDSPELALNFPELLARVDKVPDSLGVSSLLRKQPGFVLGWGAGEGAPSPAQQCRSMLRIHCATLSKAGILSGHRMVLIEGFTPMVDGHGHFLAACRKARNSSFSAAS